eukprot:COSAG06_NODE_57_length_27525_cov_14.855279_28_plen_214_part_00
MHLRHAVGEMCAVARAEQSPAAARFFTAGQSACTAFGPSLCRFAVRVLPDCWGLCGVRALAAGLVAQEHRHRGARTGATLRQGASSISSPISSRAARAHPLTIASGRELRTSDAVRAANLSLQRPGPAQTHREHGIADTESQAWNRRQTAARRRRAVLGPKCRGEMTICPLIVGIWCRRGKMSGEMVNSRARGPAWKPIGLFLECTADSAKGH